MIADLLSVAGSGGREPLRRNLRGLVAEAVLTGVGFALMVPLLRALFDGRIAAAWGWIAAMAALLVVYAAVRYRTQLAGYLAAIALARSLFDRLGEQIARLPLGWFGAERVGQVGRLASQGVIDVIGVPAHLLRPLVTALATPATVLALMFFFDWRLAAAALVTAPAAYLLYRWTGALTEAADHRVHAAATEAAGR
ncbi:MAG: ABC transporter transmembrane domain-containing protein, partial [Pseudomonadota bacterium]